MRRLNNVKDAHATPSEERGQDSDAHKLAWIFDRWIDLNDQDSKKFTIGSRSKFKQVAQIF